MCIKSPPFLLILCLVLKVNCNDLNLGSASNRNRKIFSEIRKTDPNAVGRHEDITIVAPNNEIITAIFVKDLSRSGEGEAYIESGGLGQGSVTISLSSNSHLRGYKFLVEVYSSGAVRRKIPLFASHLTSLEADFSDGKKIFIRQQGLSNINAGFENNVEAYANRRFMDNQEDNFDYPYDYQDMRDSPDAANRLFASKLHYGYRMN